MAPGLRGFRDLLYPGFADGCQKISKRQALLKAFPKRADRPWRMFGLSIIHYRERAQP
jgi:hypothetical protein